MTALERATRYVAHRAAATALVIVPLAIASPTGAAVILDPGSAFPTGGAAVTPLPGGVSTFAPVANGGIKFFGTQDYASSAASGGGYELGLVLDGTGSGTLDMTEIDAHFDFTVAPEVTDPGSFTASIEFFINGVSRGVVTGLGPNASGDLVLSGWAPGEALTSWGVVLAGQFAFQGIDVWHLAVPDNSISLTPRIPGVPEPALGILVATALGVAARRRFC